MWLFQSLKNSINHPYQTPHRDPQLSPTHPEKPDPFDHPNHQTRDHTYLCRTFLSKCLFCIVLNQAKTQPCVLVILLNPT